MEVCDAVDPPGTVTGVGHSVQTHLTHGTAEAARMVGVAQCFQNLGKRGREQFDLWRSLKHGSVCGILATGYGCVDMTGNVSMVLEFMGDYPHPGAWVCDHGRLT